MKKFGKFTKAMEKDLEFLLESLDQYRSSMISIFFFFKKKKKSFKPKI